MLVLKANYVKLLLIISFCCIIFLSGYSQKNIQTNSQIWLAYLANIKVSNKCSVGIDGNYRTNENWVNNISTLAIRPFLNYHFNKKTVATVGYAFFVFPNDASTIYENRSWQQIQLHQNIHNGKLLHRIRTEQRFRNTYENKEVVQSNFNHRFRYMLSYTLPFGKKDDSNNKFSSTISNEIHLNAGREEGLHLFDQNRLYTCINYHINSKITYQIGYMYLHQQLSGIERFRDIHGLRLTIVQNF
jgi:Protein of unknown function (DUF2490)